MAETPPRKNDRTGDGDEGSDRKRDHDAQQEELLRKLPDEAAPDQERGERHATGKGTATGGPDQDQDQDD